MFNTGVLKFVPRLFLKISLVGLAIGLLPNTQSSADATDGVFTGDPYDTGFGLLQVSITIANGLITNANVIQFPNSSFRAQQINAQAIPDLIVETIQAQSANIQGVGGASYTSKGWQTSLASAISNWRSGITSSTTTASPNSPALDETQTLIKIQNISLKLDSEATTFQNIQSELLNLDQQFVGLPNEILVTFDPTLLQNQLQILETLNANFDSFNQSLSSINQDMESLRSDVANIESSLNLTTGLASPYSSQLMDAFNVMESKFSSLNGNIQNIPFNITKFGNDISNSIASAEARMPNLVSGQPLPDQSYSDLLTSGLSCPKVTPIPGSKAQDQIMDTHSLIYCHLGVERQNIALDENQAALIDSQFNNLEASLTSDSEDLLLATLTSLASSLGELSNSISSDSYGYIPYVSDYVKINESKLSDLQLNIGGLLSKFKTFQNSSDLMLKGSEIKQKFGTATLALQGIFDTTSKIESLQAQNLTSYIKPKIVLISWVCVKNKVIKGFSGKVQKCPAGFRLKQ